MLSSAEHEKSFVISGPGLCLTWSERMKMDFLMTWLICVSGHIKFIKKKMERGKILILLKKKNRETIIAKFKILKLLKII